MKPNKILLCIFLSCSLPAMAALKPAADPTLKPQQNTLIYSYDEMFNFDIEGYLASQAPHLLPYAEVISHWSGYTSISPKVLLTLIEQESGLLTQKYQQKNATSLLQDPFGKLSDLDGFAQQFQDVADKLANRIYAQDVNPGAAEFGNKIIRHSSKFDVLFAPDSNQTDTQRLQNAERSAKFAELYYQLFKDEFSPLEQQPADNDIKAQASNGFLQFPFPVGQSWHIGGAHTNTGSGNYPMSSLDMSVGGGWGSNQSNVWVAASAQGQFKRHSSCFAEVVHANNWSTTYYHLMNIQYSTGANISKNTKIANPANTRGQALCDGGQSTGPHQHWSLKRYGNWYHLNGAYLSGWKITATGNSYDTNCNLFYLTKNNYSGCAGYYSH